MKLTEVIVSEHVATSGYRLGATLTLSQIQWIAHRNGLKSHAAVGEVQDMTGLRIIIDDLHPESGWRMVIPHFESLAARVGATIHHPELGTTDAYTRASYFDYPRLPRVEKRSIKKSVDVTPTTNDTLATLRACGISLADLVEEAAQRKWLEISTSPQYPSMKESHNRQASS
jgi:hypothetical protein